MFAFDTSVPVTFPAPQPRPFFMHPFSRYLLNDNYVSGTVLRDKDKVVNKKE